MIGRKLSELPSYAANRRENAARERLGAVVETRKHLEHMVVFWEGKAAEIAAHLEGTKANLAKAKIEETELREQVIPMATKIDKESRKAELLAEMERVQAEMAKLAASEL
jgi:hypothetical protein